MSAEDLQLIIDSKNDDSVIKRDFTKLYHQHGAGVKVENQNIKFSFGKIFKFIQIGNGYLDLDIKINKADGTNFTEADVCRRVSNQFADVFQDGRLCTSSGTVKEQNKYLDPVSTDMRLLTHKDGDISTNIGKIYQTEIGTTDSSIKRMLIDSLVNVDHNGKKHTILLN